MFQCLLSYDLCHLSHVLKKTIEYPIKNIEYPLSSYSQIQDVTGEPTDTTVTRLVKFVPLAIILVTS